MEKKYKLTEESINYFGKTLYRIEALKDFDIVKKGDKGGYVESEENLSQEEDCWISDNAKVFDSAVVSGNAKVYGNAKVCGNTKVFGDAYVYGNALVYNNAVIYGKAEVFSDAVVYDKVRVFDDAFVYDNAEVFGHAKVYGNAKVFDNALVYSYAKVCGDAEIKDNSDYIVFKNWWSSGRHFTWTRSNNMWRVGCFYGTGKELIANVYEDSELSGREYERVVNYVESMLQDTKYIRN